MRTLLIHSAHHRLANYDVSKTYRDISKDTSWRGQWEETKKFVEGCHTCQIIKQLTQRPAGNAQIMQVPERPWRSISMDVLGPFLPSKGFEHALVVVDRFSSLVKLVPMKKKYTIRDIVDPLISKVYCYHGISQEIISDRGRQFISNFFRELHKAFDVHLMPSTAFQQQTNGSVERTIKMITQTLRAYVNAKLTDWVDHLCKAEYAHINDPSEAYRTSPAEICQGQIVSLRNYKPTNSTAVDQYLENLELSHKVYYDNLIISRYI